MQDRLTVAREALRKAGEQFRADEKSLRSAVEFADRHRLQSHVTDYKARAETKAALAYQCECALTLLEAE